MSQSAFDMIAQEILQQQKIMEEIEADNRRLKQQLQDLREGKGLFVEIEGKRIALNMLFVSSGIEPEPPNREVAPPEIAATSIVDIPTAEIMTVPKSEKKLTAALEQQEHTQEKKEQAATEMPGFLEEIMINEFASALTTSAAVWQGPIKKPEQGNTDDEQKAALRRALMGSYILE